MTTGEPLITYAARIAENAAMVGDDLAARLVGVDGSSVGYTWSELDRWSRQVAAAFAARGVGAGDRVTLGLGNTAELVAAALGCWRLGAVPIPTRWDLPDWERQRVVEVIAPRLALVAADRPWLVATRSDPAPDLPDAVSPQAHGICSSGSTGMPKIIMQEYPGRFDPARVVPFAAGWGPVPRPDTILVMAPMYHANGFATLSSMLGGDRLVVMERFSAAQAVDLIESERITTFTATPTMLQRIADLAGIDDRDLSSLTWILQGAAPMPPSLVDRWAGLIGAERIVMAYGMTEGLGLTALRGDEWMAHRGSVGRGIRGTEVKVLGPDQAPQAAGEIGEIYLRSPMARAYSYLGGAPLLPATDDGFQTAGDLGYLDEEGFVFLVDRRVDMIVSGGANVFPAEVECALIDHPQIADVVVIGLADPEWGRRVHAIVEPAPPSTAASGSASTAGANLSAADVIAYAKSRLAPYKVPKSVEFVAAVPRSEATKVNRRALIDARGG